jgi:hypothetical protein
MMNQSLAGLSSQPAACTVFKGLITRERDEIQKNYSQGEIMNFK